jgi:hypothetical protein
MQNTLFDLNPVLTHADVVTSTTAPSGSTFTATDAAVSTGFFYSTPEYYSWRILLQVCDMQLRDYELAQNGDRELWKTRILSTLQWINRLAVTFHPSRLPLDLRPATAGSLALTASGANWCDAMSGRLSKMFLNVPNVDTLKIELHKNQLPVVRDLDD